VIRRSAAEVPPDEALLTITERLRREADTLDRLRDQIWQRLTEEADKDGDNGS